MSLSKPCNCDNLVKEMAALDIVYACPFRYSTGVPCDFVTASIPAPFTFAPGQQVYDLIAHVVDKHRDSFVGGHWPVGMNGQDCLPVPRRLVDDSIRRLTPCSNRLACHTSHLYAIHRCQPQEPVAPPPPRPTITVPDDKQEQITFTWNCDDDVVPASPPRPESPEFPIAIEAKESVATTSSSSSSRLSTFIDDGHVCEFDFQSPVKHRSSVTVKRRAPPAHDSDNCGCELRGTEHTVCSASQYREHPVRALSTIANDDVESESEPEPDTEADPMPALEPASQQVVDPPAYRSPDVSAKRTPVCPGAPPRKRRKPLVLVTPPRPTNAPPPRCPGAPTLARVRPVIPMRLP